MESLFNDKNEGSYILVFKLIIWEKVEKSFEFNEIQFDKLAAAVVDASQGAHTPQKVETEANKQKNQLKPVSVSLGRGHFNSCRLSQLN
jgi:hypothetical protein